VHQLPFKHWLGAIGQAQSQQAASGSSMGDVYAASVDKGGASITDLATLLDHGLRPGSGEHGGGVRGDMSCVGNTGMGAGYYATSGAGYRHVCDLSLGGLWTVDGQGQYRLHYCL